MRSSSSHRAIRSVSSIPWSWIIIVGAIIGIILFNSLLSGRDSDDAMGTALSVNPGSGSEVYIKPATGSAKQISEMEQLYTTDTSLSVTSGVATFSSEFIDGTIDKSSEMAYRERLADGEKIEFSRGRLWVESK